MNDGLRWWWRCCSVAMTAVVAATWLASDGISGAGEGAVVAVLAVLFIGGLAVGIPRLRQGAREALIEGEPAVKSPIRPSLNLAAGVALLLAAPVVVWEMPTQLRWAWRASDGRVISYLICLVVALVVTVFVGARLIASAFIPRR